MLFTNTEYGNFAKDPAVVAFQGKYFLYYSIRYKDGRFVYRRKKFDLKMGCRYYVKGL